MGFGHRVYKNYDPRATIIKKACDDVFEVTGVNPLLSIAIELEKIALEDEYFVKRKLYPNVDFYSGPDLRGARAAGRGLPGDVRDRRARAAGSPSGSRCWTTRSRRSRARGRSTRATAASTTCRCPPAADVKDPLLCAARHGRAARRRRTVGFMEFRLNNGTDVVIRPIRPDDKARLATAAGAAVGRDACASASSARSRG